MFYYKTFAKIIYKVKKLCNKTNFNNCLVLKIFIIFFNSCYTCKAEVRFKWVQLIEQKYINLIICTCKVCIVNKPGSGLKLNKNQ